MFFFLFFQLRKFLNEDSWEMARYQRKQFAVASIALDSIPEKLASNLFSLTNTGSDAGSGLERIDDGGCVNGASAYSLMK